MGWGSFGSMGNILVRCGGRIGCAYEDVDVWGIFFNYIWDLALVFAKGFVIFVGILLIIYIGIWTVYIGFLYLKAIKDLVISLF